MREMFEACQIKTWAENCAYQNWKFACYIMSLPHERWARRMLQWQPFGRRPVGRPAMHRARYVQEAGVLTWAQRSLQQYWHLCSYIAGLPAARWVSKTLAWRPRNIRKRRGTFRMWHSAAETFRRWKSIANWQAAAMNTEDWLQTYI